MVILDNMTISVFASIKYLTLEDLFKNVLHLISAACLRLSFCLFVF